MLFDSTITQFAFYVLLQSTLLVVVGFGAVKFCGRNRPVVHSVILRVTLIAVLLCPLVSFVLGKFGVTNFATLPAWGTQQIARLDNRLPSENRNSLATDTGEMTMGMMTENNVVHNTSLNPHQKTELLSANKPVLPNPNPDLSVIANLPVGSPPNVDSANSFMPTISWSVALVWLVGTSILLIKFIRANLQAVQLRRDSQEAGVEIRELCQQTSKMLRLLPPETKISSHVHSPCLIGIRHPLILLPEQNTLTQSTMRDVFLHELAHLARRDCLFHLLARLTTAVLFFQPLLWLLSRRLEQIADDICDDYVIYYGSGRKSYANTLVDFAEHLPMPSTTVESGLTIVSFRSSLSRRILRILDSSRSLNLRLNTGWIVAIVLLGISATTSAALVINARSASIVENENRIETSQSEKGNQFVAVLENNQKTNSDKTAQKNSPKVAKKQNIDAKQESAYRFQGKVLDPNGEPIKQATINFTRWDRLDKVILATTNDEGIFDFTITPSNELYPLLRDEGGTFMAMADGYGLVLKSAHYFEISGAMGNALRQRILKSRSSSALIEQNLKRAFSGSPTFQLRTDDIPLNGRVVDIDGQPVKGAKLKVATLIDGGKDGLDAWEKAAQQAGTNYYQLQHLLGMRLGNDIGGSTLNFIPEVVTDNNGRFTFKGLGRDRLVNLLISGPDIATSRVYARTRKGATIEVLHNSSNPSLGKFIYHPATFTHVAGPSLPVEGVIRDAKTKKVMAGATLKSYQLAGQQIVGWTETIVQTVSDDRGRYRLEGLPIGKNKVLGLSSLDQPYLISNITMETRVGGGTLNKDVELTRGVWIEGRAYDKNSGEPIRAGRVAYFPFHDNPFKKTVKDSLGSRTLRYRLNSDGTYRIPALPGRGIVGILADDFTKYQRGRGVEKIKGNNPSSLKTLPYFLPVFSYHVILEVNPAEDAETILLDFPFDSGRLLKVPVVDQNGKPVSGGHYSGMMEVLDTWQVFNKSHLEVRGYEPDKPRRVQVSHKEHKLVGFRVFEGKNPTDLKITLQPWAEITGRLIDKEGVPKANATIGNGNSYMTVVSNQNLAKFPHNINELTGQRKEFVTDENGRFTIVGFVPGKKYHLKASETRKKGKNFIAYTLGEVAKDLILKPGEVRDLGDIRLYQSGAK